MRVHDRGARDGRLAGSGRGSRAARCAPRRTNPSSGDSTPATVRSSVVLPAPFGPTTPMRSPRVASRRADPQDGHALGGRRAPREADEHRLQASAPRPRSAPGRRRAAPGSGSASLGLLPRRLGPRREQRLQALLVLVHLGVLAMAPIALDELPLARDLLRRRVGVLALPGVAPPRAAGGTRSSRP